LRREEKEEALRRLRDVLESVPKNARETARTLNPESSPKDWLRMDTPLEEIALQYRARIPDPSTEPIKPRAWSQVERELGPIAETALDLANRLENMSPEALSLVRELSYEYESTDFQDRTPIQRLWSHANGYAYFSPEVRVSFDEDADPSEWMGHDGMGPHELKALAGILKHLQKQAGSRKETPPPRKAMPEHERIQCLISSLGERVVTQHGLPQAHVVQIAKAIHQWATQTSEDPGESWGLRALERWRQARKNRISESGGALL